MRKRYQSSAFKHPRRTSGKRTRGAFSVPVWTIAVVVGVILFFVLVLLFRSSNKKDQQEMPSSLLPTSTLEVLPETVESPDATIRDIQANKTTGTATRRIENNGFHLTFRAALPSIDRSTHFYQVWMIRPVPYDYFSVGEMTTDASGAFVLDWSGGNEKDYTGYTKFIVTLQTRDGETDPQTHVAEGAFGKQGL